MKKTVLTVLALAVLLTGCAKGADTTDTTNNVQMRVQDGYIQYYNGTDWQNLVSTDELKGEKGDKGCLLYTSPSPRDRQKSRMPSSA